MKVLTVEKNTVARGRHNFSIQKRWAVLADYKAGHPIKKIMEKHGVSISYACNTARAYFGKARSRINPNLNRAEFIDDYFKGMNCKTIASKHKVGKCYIWVVLKAAGLTPNRNKRTKWEKVR